jgi:hypothetical protein
MDDKDEEIARLRAEIETLRNYLIAIHGTAAIALRAKPAPELSNLIERMGGEYGD